MTRPSVVIACVILACASSLSFAQGNAGSSIEQQVLSARQAREKAMDRCDVATITRMTAPKLISTTAPGRFFKFEEIEKPWSDCKPASDQERVQGLRVTAYGGGAIVEGVRWLRRFDDAQFTGPRRFFEVWVRGEGGWQQAAHHGTLVDLSPDAPSFAAMPERRGDRAEAVATAGRTTDETAEEGAEAAVTEANNSFNRAIASGESDTLRRLTTDDYSDVNAVGLAVGRTQWLSGIKPRPGLEAASPTVRRYGDLALVAGESSAPGAFEHRYTRVWVRRNGEWKAVISQESPIMRRATER